MEIGKKKLIFEDEFAKGELPANRFNSMFTKYTKRVADLQVDIAQLNIKQKNYMKYIKFGVSLLSNIDI